MKVSYQWLSQYVDLSGYSAEELAEKLTRSGIEVDVVENRNLGVEKVVVGYVKEREKHPDADKLSVCKVDVGGEEELQIVCGAKNVAAGQKVPVAVIGAKLPPDGFTIKRAKLRGIESQGMICSAKELGLNDRLLPKEIQEGILVLPENTPVGQSILDVLALEDKVMELDLTPNRSDCLSMLGAAYEIGAILGREVKLPDSEAGLVETGASAKDSISVAITAEAECSHYAARLIEGVTIGASPLWLQNRLMAAGIRPINNVVDITNYVMLEYGQPLHAFDADVIEGGRIEVRLADAGERIVTLDDAERELTASMLLITDGNRKPVGIAGVMGGASSEVTASTARILLESARFDGGSVRKTSRQLGLRSEASLRFEKSVNPEAVIPALNRAAALMCELAGGKSAAGIVEASAGAVQAIEIELTLDKVNRYLGTELSLETVKSIFDRLYFSYEDKGGDTLLVHAPKRRGDITRDVDLIEEIARLYGYDNIPITLIEGKTTPGSLTKQQIVRREARHLLAQSGLNEVISYSFTHPEQIAQYRGRYTEAAPIALAMPMSEERSAMRTSLIPHLLDTAVYNRNRNNDDVAVFEIGRVFVTSETALTKLPEERLLLSLLWTGNRTQPGWTAAKPEKADFYDLKGVLDKLFAHFGLSGISYRAAQPEGLHPGRTAQIVLNTPEGEVLLGVIGQLHPQLQLAKDLDDTYIAELELDTLSRYASFAIEYRTLPRYPAVSRDLAVVVDSATPVGGLEQAIRQTAGDLLEAIQVFDVYAGERFGADKKSVALSLTFRHLERTLTDEEITELNSRIIGDLENRFAAQLRKS